MKPSVIPSASNPFLTPLSSANILPGKRKLADSLLDEDEPPTKTGIDDGPAAIDRLSKMNIKRPRMLDMNKIRSLVLANDDTKTLLNESLQQSNISTENSAGWKQYPTYDAYRAAKKQPDEPHRSERAFRLPRLTQKDYHTAPAIADLRTFFNDQGQCFVKEFTVTREHYGSVTFQGSKMNLAGLDLNRLSKSMTVFAWLLIDSFLFLVEIDRRQVTVYPNDQDRPNEGEELNCQAIISLFGVYPIDRSKCNHSGEEVTDPDRLIAMKYRDYLEGMTGKFHGQFINYDVYTGTWTFQVDHFWTHVIGLSSIPWPMVKCLLFLLFRERPCLSNTQLYTIFLRHESFHFSSFIHSFR